MKKHRFVSMLLIICLSTCWLIPSTKTEAVELYATSKKLQKGSNLKIKLYFYYGKTKPKWSTSNKKIKIVKKTKRSCTIKGLKTGSSYVKCKIGKKAYKIKISVKPKSLVTYNNFNKLKYGMSIDDVEQNILGNCTDVVSVVTQTQEEYDEYYQWNIEDNGRWQDHLYMERIQYVWVNPWNYHCIYATFNDGILVDKMYN